MPHISIGGHVGGLIGGGLAAAVLYDLRDRVRVSELVSTVLVVALGAAAVAGSIAVSASA